LPQNGSLHFDFRLIKLSETALKSYLRRRKINFWKRALHLRVKLIFAINIVCEIQTSVIKLIFIVSTFFRTSLLMKFGPRSSVRTVALQTLIRRYSVEPLETPPSGGLPKTYPKHVEDIVDSIAKLNLLEVSSLNNLLKVCVIEIWRYVFYFIVRNFRGFAEAKIAKLNSATI